MNKTRVVSIIKSTIDSQIPDDVRQWLKSECPIVVDDLSNWDISLVRKTAKGKELLGVFGFEDSKPVIGVNNKALRTVREAARIVKHEIAHFVLWRTGLPNGERATNKLVKEWEALA